MELNTGGKIGLVIGLLGGLAGIGVAMVVQPLLGLLVAVPLVLVFGFIYTRLIRPAMERKKLLKTGERARGEIIEMWDTGWTVNQQPRIGLKVKVMPEQGHPYEATVKLVISRLQAHAYQPGTELTVRFHPDQPEKVAIESFGYAGTSADLAALQAELEEVDRFNKELNGYGEAAAAIVMDVKDHGIPINNDIRYLTLKVKVMPEAGDPFDSELKGLFRESSVEKYAAGREIRVKYSKYEQGRVTVAL